MPAIFAFTLSPKKYPHALVSRQANAQAACTYAHILQPATGHLSPIIDDLQSGDQGWEERTDAAMTHLLRTVSIRLQ